MRTARALSSLLGGYGLATVATSIGFWEAYTQLPKKIQKKASNFLTKFQADPSSRGLNYERLHSADQKLCSVRIDDTYRVILARDADENAYILLWVDHHDDAYKWAENRHLEVNQLTGALQLYETVETVHAVPMEQLQYSLKPLYAEVPDAKLLQMGVPEKQLSMVRGIMSGADLAANKSAFPDDAYICLEFLANGEPIENVLALIDAEQTTVKADDLASAIASPTLQTAQSFYVIHGQDELKHMLAAPLEKWRVFLHPEQRKIVNKQYAGPARVLGGAGTGKTVVAMHRAKWLASQLEGHEKLLFTTFTRNLVADIQGNLANICTPDELSHIEVKNLDAWLTDYLAQIDGSPRVIYGKDLTALWTEAIASAGTKLSFPAQFYPEEWERVVIAQNVQTLEDYLAASRKGRGSTLGRKQKVQVWDVMEEYRDLMHERGVWDIDTAMNEAAKMLATEDKARYEHVVVDEGQDFGDSAYRLMRALVRPHDNDIFVVGDSHQRIYKHHPVLTRYGISVRGRGTKLRVNYRTTQETRQFAFAILEGIPFDDLDGGRISDEACHSLTHGAPPVVKKFDRESQEAKYLKQEIEALIQSGVDARDICITARTQKLVNNYMNVLADAGIRVCKIETSSPDDAQQDGVRVATMHRVKGLEFKYVFVAAAHEIPTSKFRQAMHMQDPLTREENLNGEKCLLYVALTRAQKGAYVTGYGKKFPLLEQ